MDVEPSDRVTSNNGIAFLLVFPSGSHLFPDAAKVYQVLMVLPYAFYLCLVTPDSAHILHPVQEALL